MNNIIEKYWLVPSNPEPARLDAYIAAQCKEFSRAQIQNWIKTGAILLNAKSAKASLRLSGQEEITLKVQLEQKMQDLPQAIPLKIVYEDDELMVINKPIGLVVHPGAGQSHNTLLNALLHHHPALEYLPRAGILHRLDKNTSGLLLIAKTMLSFHDLRKQLQERTLSREYHAIVTGGLISGGTIDAPIGRHPHQRKRMSVNESGKSAVTHFRIIERFHDYTYVKVKLETGRTHQIRVHFSHIKHPIVGDAAYGFRLRASKNMSIPLLDYLRQFKHQALHAIQLGFMHPTRQEWIEIQSELPDDIKQLISLLKVDLKERNSA